MMTDDPPSHDRDGWETMDAYLLGRVQALTELMRERQASLSELGRHRRAAIRSLRERKVPYRLIASSMGVSEQAIYADLRKHPVKESGAHDE